MTDAQEHGEAHAGYVAAGGCPATMPLNPKCWCNGKAGHSGYHFAPHIEPSGRVRRNYWSERNG